MYSLENYLKVKVYSIDEDNKVKTRILNLVKDEFNLARGIKLVEESIEIEVLSGVRYNKDLGITSKEFNIISELYYKFNKFVSTVYLHNSEYCYRLSVDHCSIEDMVFIYDESREVFIDSLDNVEDEVIKEICYKIYGVTVNTTTTSISRKSSSLSSGIDLVFMDESNKQVSFSLLSFAGSHNHISCTPRIGEPDGYRESEEYIKLMKDVEERANKFV